MVSIARQELKRRFRINCQQYNLVTCTGKVRCAKEGAGALVEGCCDADDCDEDACETWTSGISTLWMRIAMLSVGVKIC